TYMVKYPNGTELEVTDFFADEKTISRKIRAITGGAMALGGEFNGTATYDSKKGYMQVEGDGFKYVVAPKRKLNPKFYANEADMLAVKNGSDTATGTTGFWTVGLSNFTPEDELYMAISLDTELSMDELGELVKDKINATKAETFYNDRIVFWDTYLIENAIPSTYIINPAITAE
ncbi:MAG: hypothetical protein K0S55_301, partial [Clostridia bacterium]|nr:hypothetical protein [Clostridia bacterium]